MSVMRNVLVAVGAFLLIVASASAQRPHIVNDSGVAVTNRIRLNFDGCLTATDDSGTESTDIALGADCVTAGIIGIDAVQTAELDDANDIPAAGEYVRVDGSDTAKFQYTADIEVPDGTAPTADVDGEIVIDETANQLIYQGSGTDHVMDPKHWRSVMIENLAAADDDLPLFHPPHAITLKNASCECHGTCTTEADITLERDSGGTITAITGTITCEDTTAGDAATALSGAGASIGAIDTVRLDVTNAVSPETDTYTLTIDYTIDRQ